MSVLPGFSTLEVVLALAIIASALTAVMGASIGAPRMLENGALSLEATRRLSSLVSSVAAHSYINFDELGEIATSTEDGFTMSVITETSGNSYLKKVTGVVSYTNAQGDMITRTLSMFVTDFKNAPERSCSSIPRGNWNSPAISVYALRGNDLFPHQGFASTYAPSSLASQGSFLYVGVDQTGDRADPTIAVFSISPQGEKPEYRGSIDNAPTTKTGIASLIAHNEVLFAASAFGPNFTSCTEGPQCAQLQIFNVANPETPTLVRNMQLPTTTPPFALGENGQASGRSLAYRDNLLYLGLSKTGSDEGMEFNIVNVENPERPVWLGGYHIGRTVTSITLEGNIAFLTTTNTDTIHEIVLMLDITNPSHVTLLGTYAPPGAVGFGHGVHIATAKERTYVLRSYTNNAPELEVLDSSIPSNSVQLFAEDLGTFINPQSGKALILRDTLLAVLTHRELQIWSVAGESLTAFTLPVPLGGGTTGTAMTCRGNTLYVGSKDADGNGYVTTITGS